MKLDLLRKHIQKRVPLTEREFDRCSRFFVPRKVRKRQFLLEEGDVCTFIGFVTDGCLRVYTLDRGGGEHIIQFAIPDWWVSDLHSYLSGDPASYLIDAVEDSHVLLLERGERDRLFDAVPKMERFFRLLQEANYVATHRRIAEALGSSAEERYLAFLAAYPALAEKVPQNQIASYLGVTPQSLSRIRKSLSRKK